MRATPKPTRTLRIAASDLHRHASSKQMESGYCDVYALVTSIDIARDASDSTFGSKGHQSKFKTSRFQGASARRSALSAIPQFPNPLFSPCVGNSSATDRQPRHGTVIHERSLVLDSHPIFEARLSCREG